MVSYDIIAKNVKLLEDMSIPVIATVVYFLQWRFGG